MRSEILARLDGGAGGWTATAHERENVICTVSGSTAETALAALRAQVPQRLAGPVREWLSEWRGTAGAPTCPEAAIRLPIDLWVCKLTDSLCPTQGQVLLDAPEEFLAACLAPGPRRQALLRVSAEGRYGGFHHVPGRYMCVVCSGDATQKQSFAYHYPWELATISVALPAFSIERDWPALRSRLGSGVSLSWLTCLLCARHCVRVANDIDPIGASMLRVLEYELSREGRLTIQ